MQSGDSLPPESTPLQSSVLGGSALGWPEVPGDLPRSFGSRAELQVQLQQLFPKASGELSPLVGGWAAAGQRLAAIDPSAYGRSRNHLDGAVTRLSPSIRHGVLSLAAVRNAVFGWLHRRGLRGPAASSEAQQLAGKLINELGWRDYWQRLWQ